MKRPTRFQTVVRVKKHQEKVTQQQLVQIEDVHDKEKEKLTRLNTARDEALGSAQDVGRARATDLQAQRAFIFKLSRQIDHQASKVEEIRGKADEKREELTKRAQSRQMVEKLEEKRKAEVTREEDKKEQQLIDEVANRTDKKVS